MKPRYIVALLVLALAMFFGVLERESVLVHWPLPCTATLSQRGAGEQWLTRCYISSSDKGKQ